MAANQPRQAPSWVRLALRARPANGPEPTPAPEPPPPHPQPLLARLKLRQIGQPQRPPTQSQEPALPAPPPCHLSLPPSRIKSNADLEPKIPLDAEQKTVAIQKTIGKPNDWPWTKGTESGSNFPEARKPTATHISRNEEMEEKGAEVHGKKISSDSEEVGMRVITIAGENEGASMEIFRSPKKNVIEGNSYYRNRKENPSSGSSSDQENNLKTKDKSHKGMPMNAPPMRAFMNSNVQRVNNSLVFQSSCTHHDPGVHLSLSQKPAAGDFDVKDRGNGHKS